MTKPVRVADEAWLLVYPCLFLRCARRCCLLENVTTTEQSGTGQVVLPLRVADEAWSLVYPCWFLRCTRRLCLLENDTTAEQSGTGQVVLSSQHFTNCLLGRYGSRALDSARPCSFRRWRRYASTWNVLVDGQLGYKHRVGQKSE